MKTLITIPIPCHENWEAMQKEEKSRFCNSCQKSVMDFTQMSRDQIQSYFMEQKGKKVCGRFQKSQLSFASSYPEVNVYPIFKQKQQSSLPFYLLTASTLFLASCSNEKQPTVIGKVESKQDTISYTMGVPAVGKDDKENCVMGKPKINSSSENEPVINEVEGSLTGDVVYIEQKPVEPKQVNGDIVGFVVDQPNNNVHTFVDEQAEFPGGYKELINYIKSKIQYPQWELENKIEGKVYTRFVVGKDGKIRDARILRGVDGASNLDREALRVISTMPDWKPALVGGKVVDSYFDLPINFKL